ncbi:MAG: trigger factor [Clostridiales bacterium]|nr:trigger factor [Clostridiales bacterium]
MKKKIGLVAMGLLVSLLAVGCGDKQKTADSEYSQYVTLGEYKKIEVEAESVEVTEEELETRITSMFREVIEMGDTANLNYEGLLDGVAFEGGTADNYDLNIGSGQFIPGFEDQLVGVKVGDTVALDITFPEDYGKEELNGQAVVFNVTVNNIAGVEAAELNEDYVKANTEFTTIEEYKESVKAEMLVEKEEIAKTNKIANVWEVVKTNAVVNSYPEELVTKYSDSMKNYYTQFASMYGMQLADYLVAVGSTQEEFDTECKTYGEQATAEYMILSMIASEEKITISDEEYDEELAQAVIEAGAGSAEELEEAYGGKEVLRENFLFNKIIEYVADAAVEV